MNAQRRVQGQLDSPLDDLGRVQAQALARRVAREAPVILYASPLRRASETAQIVAAHLNVPLLLDDRLKERDAGAIAGLTNEEIEAQFPEWLQQWRASAGHAPPPGAEPRAALRHRAVAAFDEIVARHAGAVVGIVSHGALLGAYLCYLIESPLDRRSLFALGNCSLTIVDLDVHPLIRLVGDQCHLDGEGG
ncbi:MAG: histidine phosphatase family protein [Anaerolineae bacterium]|nr:histidine phosphatase family protein [Anaerolineae bacterium]